MEVKTAIPENIKLAKDLIQQIIKAKKTIQLYPPNNPIYANKVDDVFSRFGDFFKYKDEFILKIKQYEILWESAQVYHNPEKYDNIALLFFKDGLKEISFKKDLTKKELEEFLKIISIDFDKTAVNDDIVTLLWEKDFQNIKYVVDETFLLENEDYESKAVAEIKSKSAGEDNFQEAYENAVKAEDLKHAALLEMTEDDLRLLVKEIEKDQKNKSGKLAEILFEMLICAKHPGEYKDIQNFFRALIIYSINNGDLNLVIDIIKKTKSMAESLSADNGIKHHYILLMSFINSDETTMPLGELLDSDIEVKDEILNEYAGFLSKDSIMPFISILGELQNMHARKKVIGVLIGLGKKDINAIAKGLKDSRWYVVRNIIYIMRHIGDKNSVGILLNLNADKHSDTRVRKEAIKAMGELNAPLAFEALKECLSDHDPSIRRTSVKAISSIGSEDAKKIIISAVSKKDFLDRTFEDKKDFYESLAGWDDADTVNFLITTLKHKSLFHKNSLNENKACAAYALGLIGSKDALPVLQKFRESKNNLLREYINEAIKKIEYGE